MSHTGDRSAVSPLATRNRMSCSLSTAMHSSAARRLPAVWAVLARLRAPALNAWALLRCFLAKLRTPEFFTNESVGEILITALRIKTAHTASDVLLLQYMILAFVL